MNIILVQRMRMAKMLLETATDVLSETVILESLNISDAQARYLDLFTPDSKITPTNLANRYWKAMQDGVLLLGDLNSIPPKARAQIIGGLADKVPVRARFLRR